MQAEGGNGLPDILVAPVDGGEPFPLANSDFIEYNAHFSPDGRWVVYQSEESGQPESYIISFPDRRIRKQLTSIGSLGCDWIDAHTIGVGTPDAVMRIAVNGDSFGRPEPLAVVPPGIVNLDKGDIDSHIEFVLSSRIARPRGPAFRVDNGLGSPIA